MSKQKMRVSDLSRQIEYEFLLREDGLFKNVFDICKYKPVATVESNMGISLAPLATAKRLYRENKYDNLEESTGLRKSMVGTKGRIDAIAFINAEVNKPIDHTYLQEEVTKFEQHMAETLTQKNKYETRFKSDSVNGGQTIYYDPVFLQTICDVFGYTLDQGVHILSTNQNSDKLSSDEYDLRMTFIEMAFGDYVGLASSDSSESNIMRLKQRHPDCLAKVCAYFSQITGPLSEKEIDAKTMADELCSAADLSGGKVSRYYRRTKRRRRNTRHMKANVKKRYKRRSLKK